MFRRALLVWLVLSFVPTFAFSQNPGIKQGDPAFYFDFPGGTISLIPGETWCENLYPGNFWWASTLCAEGLLDTFAVITSDTRGWPVLNTFSDDESDAEGVCVILHEEGDGTWYYEIDVCISVPCEAVPGELNTLTVQMAYCDESMTVQPDSGDCEDPNWRDNEDVWCWSTITQDFEVIESPPSLYILQDTLCYVGQGQSAAYVPFEICNGDPCAPPTDYAFLITNSDTLDPIEQADTTYGVTGGECVDVYGIVDASMKPIAYEDTLTIIAWDLQSGTVYDTCVQGFFVYEFCCAPVMSRTVAGILIVALIAVSAVVLKRRMM